MVKDWLAQRVKVSPAQIALIFQDEQWSYAQLSDWADSVARALQVKGVQRGDHVGVLLPNQPIHVVIIHALARLGAVAVPLNVRLKPKMLRWQISQADCAFVLCSKETEKHFGDLDSHTLNKILIDPMDWSTNPKQFSNLKTFSPPFDLEAVQGIYFTSGTTGRPKGAMLTFNNHLWSAVGSAYRLGVNPNDRWLLIIPLYHIGGQAIVFRACQYGITIVLQEGFDPERLYQALLKHRVSIVSLVPTMLNRLMSIFEDHGLPDKLRCILLGGSAASHSLVDKCIENKIPIALTYGLTEAASQVATASPAQVCTKSGSVGKPLFFSEVHIVKEDLSECQPHEIGEIVVSGPTIMKGYLQDQEATESTGVLHTGDLGYLDEEGDLWIVNRRDDLIVSGGENVYPAEVEAVLMSHPAVEEACVIGIDDPEWGQRVAAALIVSEKSTTSEQQIIEYCRQHLAGYKTPRRVRFLDQFPRTASGKIIRSAVKEQMTLKVST